MSTDRWNPIRRGAVYCAPACGGNCTWAAHQQANHDAATLVKVLNRTTFAGWTVHVYENLGWHYAAIHETARLRVSGTGRRFLAFQSDHGSGIVTGGRWTAHGSTPAKVVKAVRAMLAEECRVLAAILNAVKASEGSAGVRK